MNQKTAKLLRRAAKGMNVPIQAVKAAFKHLSAEEKDKLFRNARNAKLR